MNHRSPIAPRRVLAVLLSVLIVCMLVPNAGISFALGTEDVAQGGEQESASTTHEETSQDVQKDDSDSSTKDAQKSTDDGTVKDTTTGGEDFSVQDVEASGEGVGIQAAKDEAEPAIAVASAEGDVAAEADEATDVEAIVKKMTLDEKISQLIIPAIRTWNQSNVTDLSAVPELAEALRRHQYSGIILYGQNVESASQTSELVAALQANNASGDFTTKIGYFMPVDEEGGVVVRFSMGTRMTGSMAIGATGSSAEANARKTGEVLGEEINALGFNVDFAPALDVNSNPANPAIGVRSFSDDPQRVAELGLAFNEGLQSRSVVPTIKHFPGHGDTVTDTHLDVASVNKTLEELEQIELVPFRSAIDAGADLIMTAHITLPAYDDEVTFYDGKKGYFPATMSKKVLTDLLRGQLGFNGVVVTDALQMDAVDKAHLVAGAEGSAEYAANVAEICLNAGADILLLPKDLNSTEAAAFYDDYIKLLIDKATGDAALAARIDESVTRVLKLKEKYGILNGTEPSYELSVVGSHEHHEAEMQIAEDAITLVKNDNHTLPASGHNKKIVLVGRDKGDNVTLASIVGDLQEAGLIDEDAYVNNLATGATKGSQDAMSRVTIDYYYDASDTKTPHYTDELKAAIAEAHTVVALTKNWGTSALSTTNAQYLGISQILADTHAAGGKFVLVSGNLPYDAARYQDADAILCSYMSTAMDVDPTARNDGSTSVGAYNANAIVALETLFDYFQPRGTLPVRMPEVLVADDGSVTYDVERTLYERGHGLAFEYVFVSGEGGTHRSGSTQSLTFANNARFDRLAAVLVDGEAISNDKYHVERGSTIVTLTPDYLNSLKVGDHELTTRYDYNKGSFDVKTTFKIDGQEKKDDTGSKTASTGGTTSSTTTSTATLAKTGDGTATFLPAVIALSACALIAVALRKRLSHES